MKPGARPDLAVVLDGTLIAVLVLVAASLLAWHWAALQPVPMARAGLAAGLAGAWLAWAGWNWLGAPRMARRAAAEAVAREPMESLLVVFASQTGDAEQLAKETVVALSAGGTSARAVSLHTLDAAALTAAGRALFIVPTTGEGDAPDEAVDFVDRVMGASAELGDFRYGMLALGDRSYRHFCGFGRALHQWLRQQGATPMFEPIEVDDLEDAALARWQLEVAALGRPVEVAAWQAPSFQPWRLAARRLANPGCEGHACCWLRLEPQTGAVPRWEAGDIAEVSPRHAAPVVAATLRELHLDGAAEVTTPRGREPLAAVLARSRLPEPKAVKGLDAAGLAASLQALPSRDYSIASLPADGAIELLVRQQHDGQNRPGLGSGWLTRHAPLGGRVELRIKPHASFRVPPPGTPLILVGNGTGLAGLRALLKARIAAGERRNWLLYGERHAAHDVAWREELAAWHAAGWLEHLDLVFSRDPPARAYVQDVLRQQAQRLRAWLDAGAALRVCGSEAGMGRDVQQALHDLLGRHAVQELNGSGRYRRDVY